MLANAVDRVGVNFTKAALFSTSAKEIIVRNAKGVRENAPYVIYGTISAVLGGTSGYEDSFQRNGIAEYFAVKLKDRMVDTQAYNDIERRGLFVERPALMREIWNAMNKKKADGAYTVVYGPRGVGKTTIIESVVCNRRGVLVLRLSKLASEKQIIKDLAILIGTNNLEPQIAHITRALENGVLDDGTLITLILVIERDGIETETERSGIQTIRNISKILSNSCNCIIHLSEVNYALDFDDNAHYIYVSEFKDIEVRQYLICLGVNPDLNEVILAINNIGKNPSTIRKLQEWIEKEFPINDYINEKLRKVEQDLVSFPHQKILKELKKMDLASNINDFDALGILPKSLNNTKKSGNDIDLSNIRAVSVALKKFDAVVYRAELGKYTLSSHSHLIALRSYTPPSSKNWLSKLFCR